MVAGFQSGHGVGGMKTGRVLGLALVMTTFVIATFASLPVRAQDEPTSWNAVLAGKNEVPARPTLARGAPVFELNDDGSVSYKLIVANIQNVIASHIHIGPSGVNGPVVQFLFGPATPGGGRLDGVIATGTFTDASFVGPLAGRPMSDLLDNMTAGTAYVNVHTNDGVGDINTGPGDFPGGEIRGQIKPTD